MIARSQLLRATLIGVVLQVAMVVAGHFSPAIAENVFAIGGSLISLLVGFIYAAGAKQGIGGGALGGALAGGICAIIGIAVSVALGDTAPMVLAIGTAASTVAGAIGGLVGALFGRRSVGAV